MFTLPAEVGDARILVIDDDRYSGAHVAQMLRALGHEPLVATDWSEAISLFDESIDLVLLDMVMPKVGGLKLAPLLRERSVSYVPIVFLTGRDDDESRQRALAASGDDYLVKPVSAIDLQIRVTAMLRIRRLTQRLHARAQIDALTGVGNRRAFDDVLERYCSVANRYHRPFSLVIVDVDHFKAINDTFGHSVGDEVLVLLGQVLREGVRNADEVFRYGGEEFAIVAPETLEDGAMILAERIRSSFSVVTRACAAGRQTLSAGIATARPLLTCDRRLLFKAADDALYRAKRRGRDRVITACFDTAKRPSLI
ncbi:MAG: diguanylate cyclase [Myxococcota bacterium]